MKNKTKFPIKSCLITSLVILLTYLLCIGILASVAKYADNDFNSTIGLILLIVFSSVFGLLFLFYWIKTIFKYSKKENAKQ